MVFNINKTINIHKHFDRGFDADFIIELSNTNKCIRDIQIGDILKNGGMVYGLVEIDRSDLDKYLYLGNIFINTNKLYHILSTNNCFTSNGQIINDYNSIIDTIV